MERFLKGNASDAVRRKRNALSLRPRYGKVKTTPILTLMVKLMQQQIDIAEAKGHLDELLEKAIHGDEIVITQNNKPLVKMASIATTKPAPRFGSCKGMLTIAQEDDTHLDDFADYMR